ncbi:MAG: 30S ribosomal protein S16 [Planctomycetes bacterium]|nr:30S ribosomal protein S16 [Planctomycetota bacterium]
MAVKLRLTRFGRLNHPTYRVCATEARFKRDGRVIETLGYYLPKHPRAEEQYGLNAERIQYWLSVGAQPSETVASLIRKSGLELPSRQRGAQSADKKRKRKAKPFQPPRQLGSGRLAKKKWAAKHGSAAKPASASRAAD